ncbi:Ribonuclease H domain [Macleaya cordata]|uniref:Ribonuclease H domain n=1 Tax=Macleaya cordata TaxID=56857 RepID=A0A200QUJ8_MACCD|nr:Ribonuclease H domain [Macleaya cordata]
MEQEVQWCMLNFTGDHSVSYIKKLTFNAFFYHMWAERNRRVFRSESRTPSQVLQGIRSDVRLRASGFEKSLSDTDYNRQFMARWGLDACFSVPQLINCYWKKPFSGFVMINTDGSLNGDVAGFGAIIRDEEGNVLAAATGSSPPKTIILHELQGLETGLKLAHMHKFRNVQIGTDSMAVLSYVQRSINPPWVAITVLRNIRRMIQSFESFHICHIYRETNEAADHLASLYPTSGFLEVIPSSFAEDLKKIIFDDKNGKAYPRCVY